MIDSMKTTIRTASLGLIAAGPLLSGGARADAADPYAGYGWYTHDVFDASLRFIREGGVAVAVELVQNGLVQRGERVGDTAVALNRAEASSRRVNHRRHRCWPDA